MGPDRYKVEVLHFINPYLIWIEVTDSRIKRDDFIFEQVGIYGVLPMNITIDDNCNGLQTSISKEWMPAATLLMRNFLCNAVEVYFAPTFIDRRTSIFDDNIHKYGEIIIIENDGTEKVLSHYLLKEGLASLNECLFHQELSTGKLKTKLSLNKTNMVIHEIEKQCIEKEKHKNSVRKHAKIASTAQQLESSLTIQNVQKLNSLRNENFSMEDYLQNKLRDIEMCREVDDDPVGRGVSNPPSVVCSSKKPLLQTKLKINKDAKEQSKNLLQAAKNLLLAKAVDKTKMESPNVISDSDSSNLLLAKAIDKTKMESPNVISESDSSNKIDNNSVTSESNDQILTKQTATSLKNLSRVKKFLQTTERKIEILQDSIVYGEKNKTTTDNIKERVVETKIAEKLLDKTEKSDRKWDIPENETHTKYDFDKENKSSSQFPDEVLQSIPKGNRKETNTKKSPYQLPKNENSSHKLVAFGPPETNPSQLLVKKVPKNEIETAIKAEMSAESRTTAEIPVEQIPAAKTEDTFQDIDSHIDIEITNTETIKMLHKEALKKLAKVDTKKPVENKGDIIQDHFHFENKNPVTENKEKVIQNHFTIRESPKLNHANNSTNQEQIKEDSSSEDVKTSSSFLKKKLQLHKQSMAKHNTSAESDTSTKDSSSNAEQDKPKECSQQHTELDSDDGSTSEVLQKINSEYPDTNYVTKQEIIEHAAAIKNNANPFKNVDTNISVFVEKLVTPVLMVHTKFNKRIQPVFELRDVPFTPHIQVVLKSMSVQRPMILQSVSWFSILRGYSTFLISPSGSGKTMGYLPAVCRLVSDGNTDKYSSGPICIIVCATAKSVADIERISKGFLCQKDKVLACHPGMDELNLLTSILNGCDLLICTPSILVRLLKNNEFGVDLRRLSTFVLDDCERLSEVYASEIKFFLLKIKEALKNRVDKILKVQYVLASRIWCDFMEPLAKKAPNTLISIGAFQECVLYAKTNMTASFVPKENKINSVLEFLKEIDTSKRTVIVCRNDDEVEMLENALKQTKHVVFACNTIMNVQDLYNISLAWNDYQEPVTGPILVCCDGNLLHLNVTDAHYLIHFSLPQLFSLFCKRFSVLNDNYASIFKDNNESVKIKILMDDTNVEQLPKIMHFIKRCREEVPKVLEEICERVLAEKDAVKAKKMIPICDNLLAYAECPDYWNCKERHAILKEHDTPKDWMPKNGIVTFKIIHYHTATLYSARLLTHVVKGETIKYPQLYTKLSMKIATYYAIESNKRLHGIPKVGDICAVALKQNLFVRCQVVKILTYYQNGNPNYVIIKLIEEEKYERTRDIYLYHLPNEMKGVETHVALVRMANIQPRDKDVTFSELAMNRLKHITDTNDDLYLRGEVALTIGNCIFVHNLETCRDLSLMNETVVRHNFKQELELYAIPKPDHLPKLEKMCVNSGIPVEKIKVEIESRKKRPLPKGRWAHLEKDDLSAVFFASAQDPGTFFLRLVKFENCMRILIKDIQKHVAENPTVATEIQRGDIVLAKFPDDEVYERARVEEIRENKVKCFFVDQGDWRDVPKPHLSPITEKFIAQLPFQAIECRLLGVEPRNEEWTEFSTNWFINCFEDDSGDLKQVYAKYFTKEIPLHTGGHKYGVALIDTSTDQDIVINNVIVEVNLAKEDVNEIEYLRDLNFERKAFKSESSDSDDSDWEKVSEHNSPKSEQNAPLDNIFLKQPIRSVPLVGSDDSDIDNIDFHMSNDFMGLFKPMLEAAKTKCVPAIGQGNTKDTDVLSDSDISIVKSIHSNDIEVNSLQNKVTENKNREIENSIDKDLTQNSNDSGNEHISSEYLSDIRQKDDKVSESINTTESSHNVSLDSDDLTSPELSKILDENTKNSKSSDASTVSAIRKNTKNVSAEQIKENIELKFNTEDNRIPKLVWRQTTSDIFIKIQVIGADRYNIEIKNKHIKFDAVVDDIKYSFDFELYGVVDTENSTHSNKGQYILVNLKKVLKKNWLMLNWNGPKKYIVYDVDHIEDSSSEDEIIDERENLVKRLKNVSESESDDEFVDDVNYVYKRYVD